LLGRRFGAVGVRAADQFDEAEVDELTDRQRQRSLGLERGG